MNEKICKFLIKAKQQTYANEDVKKSISTRKGSYDYEYKDGNMTYHDTYFGGTKFMGEEIVYEDDIPIWGMNYYGVTLDENVDEKFMDKALRPALMKVGETNIIPVRGPSEYINNDYKYTFSITGDIDYFEGTENIYSNGKIIYVLKCNGGIIKK